MAEHEHGKMDTTEQEKTFGAFIDWTVRTLVIVFVVLAYLALTQT